MKCVLNSFEMLFYYCTWVMMVIWSQYNLFEAQAELFSKDPYSLFSLRDISEGSPFLERERDTSDFEWSAWKYYIQTSWLYLIFQFLVSEILRKFVTSTIKYWYILSSMLLILFNMGFVQLIIILIQPIIYFILIICGGKRISIWVTALSLLLCYNFLGFEYYFWKFLDDESVQDEKVSLLITGMLWIELRCISYCIDFIERQEKVIESGEKKHNENVLQALTNLFSYVLYLPVLYTGPIILYEDFEHSFQKKREQLWTRLKRFTVDIIIFIIYSVLLELALHFIYFNAMRSNIKLIKRLPSAAIAGGGLWMAFEFHTKYVILYGTSSAFARLDNMQAPPTPRCLGRIHVYSNFWRYFDVGLYKFLLKYIYKSCCGTLCKYKNLSKIVYKLIASFTTFAFIFLWHGTAMHIFIWSILNYTGILLENTARAVSTTVWYKHFKERVLKTDAMEVRFIAGLCGPLLVTSGISNFYFLGGTEVGHLYVGLLEWPALHNILLVLLGAYCCCHVSISLLNTPSRTDIRRRGVKS